MLEECGACGTRFAVGLPACPQCWTPAAESTGLVAVVDGDGGTVADEGAEGA